MILNFLLEQLEKKNEIEDIKWINSLDIDKYEWAFNHNELLKKLI